MSRNKLSERTPPQGRVNLLEASESYDATVSPVDGTSTSQPGPPRNRSGNGDIVQLALFRQLQPLTSACIGAECQRHRQRP